MGSWGVNNSDLASKQESKDQRIKNLQILTIVLLTGLIIMVGTNFIPVENLLENSNEQISVKSKYIIENLKGDTIDVNKYWKIIPGEPLYVNIINSDNLPEEKLQIVKDAILSTKSFTMDRKDIFIRMAN
ncbi:hypothetical protein LCGC14_0852870 [marine sediment metagenome]|uniref:Uncharacterized protein n=1 Tax=marine sediment metagenome TaxID=412755 RepID=A0A0F9PEK4_9ZZZZ